MALFSIAWFLAAVSIIPVSSAATKPGIAQLENILPDLKAKRTALVVNQASVFQGRHSIEILRENKINLVKLFALEHGVRGGGGAGEPIGDGVDGPSGLPIISLYGPRRKPSPENLRDIDTIIFDIQDVGVRFFTYISSLGLILEAAAENGKEVILLDRPNPNGDYIDGPVLEPSLRSFVGAYEIPIVYGMTIGELARMIVGESWQRTQGLRMKVVPISGYNRSRPEALEVRPSPGLRSLHAIRAYPSLALFEPTTISLGRGTDHPYEVFGVPSPPLGTFSFTPSASAPLYPGQLCFGVEFFSRPISDIPRFTTDIFTNAIRAVGAKSAIKDRHFLEQLTGNLQVVNRMIEGHPWEEIRKDLAEKLLNFRRKRAPYLLYSP